MREPRLTDIARHAAQEMGPSSVVQEWDEEEVDAESTHIGFRVHHVQGPRDNRTLAQLCYFFHQC